MVSVLLFILLIFSQRTPHFWKALANRVNFHFVNLTVLWLLVRLLHWTVTSLRKVSWYLTLYFYCLALGRTRHWLNEWRLCGALGKSANFGVRLPRCKFCLSPFIICCVDLGSFLIEKMGITHEYLFPGLLTGLYDVMHSISSIWLTGNAQC